MSKWVFLWLLFLLLMLSQVTSNYLNSSEYPDPAGAQLYLYAKNHSHPPIALSSSGSPVDDLSNSLTGGRFGPLLIQDATFFDQIQSFNRERISPRVVHSKGAGAFGYLQITDDISMYSKAKVFSTIGSRIPVTVRFSRVGGDPGSSDTIRDTRGFSLKFYTSDGIWDLLCNNSPVFFVRDALQFPNLIHSQMRNPVTHLLDPNALWDYLSLTPEAIFQAMIVFSDYGIPAGYRNINGYGIHAFELVNANGTVVYCKFSFTTNQGLKTMPVSEAGTLAGTDPDYYIRDLYNAIAVGNLPSWNFTVQIVTQNQLSSFPWDPFDPTKVWPQSDYPSMPVGQLVLTENPNNYFIDVESIGFSPSRLVPGIQPSQDKLLQGRLFAYRDAQTYRLGINSLLLTANTPTPHIYNYQRNGFARYGSNQGDAVNYFPNSFNGPVTSPRGKTSPFMVSGNVSRYSSSNGDNYIQATQFYEEILTMQQRTNLVNNIVSSLSLSYPAIQKRALSNFYNVSQELGELLNVSLAQAGTYATYLLSS